MMIGQMANESLPFSAKPRPSFLIDGGHVFTVEIQIEVILLFF